MTSKVRIVLALSPFAVTLLAGCGDCVRCEKEMDRTRLEIGEPEATELRQEGNIVTETWFYYEDNRSIVFLWDDRDCGCGVSVYDFGSAAPVLSLETRGSDLFRP